MITFITGPMFASKSTELLNRMERYYYAKKKVLLVRPKKDTRDYFSHEKTNDERLIKMKPDEIVINDFQEIMDKHFEEILRAEYKAIFIDEAFMIKDVWKLGAILLFMFRVRIVNLFSQRHTLNSPSIFQNTLAGIKWHLTTASTTKAG